MKTGDHLLLAKCLLAHRTEPLPRGFAAGFCLGSVLPDCNPVTYLRGLRCGQGLHGHHAEVTRDRICRLLATAGTGGAGFRCGPRLGTALHYLADAFTYPHHADYRGSLSAHVAYEADLHRVFAAYLAHGWEPLWTEMSNPAGYLSGMLALYRRCWQGMETDCRFITQLCGLAFDTTLQRKGKEAACREDSDYIRPVSAVR